jgi:hypothetical protein
MKVALQKTVNRVATAQPAATARVAVSPIMTVSRSNQVQSTLENTSRNIRSENETERSTGKVIQLQSSENQVNFAESEKIGGSRSNKAGIAKGNNEHLQSPYIAKFAETGILGNRNWEEVKTQPNRSEGKSTSSADIGVATFSAISKSKVSVFLIGKGLPVLLKGVSKLQKLKQNEQTHDNASTKLNQSEKAVVIPDSEGQSKSNTSQVNVVSARPAPATDENKAKQKLQESLSENIPQSIEDVDNFKSDNKAQQMSTDVMTVVQGDKNAVVSTFKDMEQVQPPAPPEHTPEIIPPEGLAPATPNMNLAQGAIAPLQKEHTDVSNFTKEADSKLQEEGVTQEQLDMVDSGDLADANKEKKGMEKMAKTEPIAVEKFARQETEKIDNDLRKEEKKERDGLISKRKINLGATSQKQKGTKSALEKKREEVASKINGIFKTAQDKVKKKLSDLETQSMKSFDNGNARAAMQFEDNVKSELDAFKDRRYTGLRGKYRKAKDWLLGMDDLPEVKAIFEHNRATFVSTINKLVDEISVANKRVIQDCKEDLANAKKEIKEYVDKLAPGLKEIGKKAAGEMNDKLVELDRYVNQKEEELQQKLADKQKAAIKAIDEKIEKMKEAMSGALSKLGKLLLLAAKKFFTWALQKFGYSLDKIEAIINKGAAVLKAIFTKPIQFVKNLVNAAITGFKNFGKNFLKHLKDSLFEWLTGSLEGLILPQTWDFKGVVSVALQMIGISYQNIRKHMVAVMGETVVASIEKTFTLVKTLITEGPMAAWEQLKEMAGEMQNAFIEAVKDFIKIKIIEQAIQWVIGIFVPGAGIVKAIIAIYDTIVFFIQKAKQIAQMIGNFLGSIGEIVSGNIGSAADALENGLARGLTLVISFLAQLLHLSGITNKIKSAIQKIRDKVDAVLAKVAKWIADKAKMLFGKVKAGAIAIIQWWKQRKGFTNADGEEHAISFQGEESSAKLMVESTPRPLVTFLADYQSNMKPNADEKAIIQQIRTKVTEIENIKSKGGTRGRSDFSKEDGENIQKIFVKIADLLGQLRGSGEPPPTHVEWKQQDGEDGVEMIAQPLSINPGGFAGSQPREESNLWKKVNARYPGEFVQGHLLNHHVHGPGIKKNLIPITRRANGRMERWGETVIKKAVLDENRILRYVVRVIEFHTKKPGFPQAEKLPKYIKMEANESLERKNGKRAKGDAVKMPNIPSEGIESVLPD